jgi:ABC-type nickel/cobalt efflux system permease component RcnA
MITLFSIIALGFVLGMRHSTDPDHVIAVTTIVARHRSLKDACLIGAFWGVGHTVTLIVVGGAIVFFSWVIPARVGLSLEFSVGLMLILLGILNISGFLQWVNEKFTPANPLRTDTHSHPHSHGDFIHTHPHGHGPEAHPHNPEQTPLTWLDRHFGRIGFYQIIRPLIVGIVHGLAGSAAVALLVLATIRDPRWAIAYLLVFGAGTIAGMMLITGAIALPFAYTGRRFSQLNHAFRIASGVISLGFGLFIAYRIGIVDGLFTSHPHWIPQ